MTAPGQPTPHTATAETTSAPRPPMPDREFDALADKVAAICGQSGVPVWTDDDRDRLDQALWHFIHPDLAGTDADPWHDPDDYP